MTLFVTAIVLIVIGVVMVFSASTGENAVAEGIWMRQAVWALFAITAMIAVIFVPVKGLYAVSYVFYGIGVLLLVMTSLFGSMGGGSERWLAFAGIRIQPSEFMKVAAVLTLARFLSIKRNRPTTYLKCIIPFIIMGVPMILVKMQPDLGTALVFGAVILPMLYWAGLELDKIFFLVSPVLSALLTAPFIPFVNPLIWVVFMLVLLVMLFRSHYAMTGMAVVLCANILAGIAMPTVYNQLEPYQQKRITTIFDPEADYLDAGYQIIHSKIAIGSGGFLGKGIGKGRYTELGFLPHAHTDFIFSVIGEETGFVGSMTILLIMLLLIHRAIVIASHNRNVFTSVAAVGIATVFAFHMFVNVGMVLGIMPVTGLPLPFLSYGGSSCITNAAMVGLLLNFKLHRHDF